MSFFVAALIRPEIQTIAQEELDAVTRRERLPTIEDRSRLPFVDAVCKEVIRWRPVVPLGESILSTHLAHAKVRQFTGVLHATTEDDVYEGFFIPKGWCSQRTTLIRCWLICIFRFDCAGKHMVRYLSYSESSPFSFNLS
jgi:Cytochrome P450